MKLNAALSLAFPVLVASAPAPEYDASKIIQARQVVATEVINQPITARQVVATEAADQPITARQVVATEVINQPITARQVVATVQPGLKARETITVVARLIDDLEARQTVGDGAIEARATTFITVTATQNLKARETVTVLVRENNDLKARQTVPITARENNAIEARQTVTARQNAPTINALQARETVTVTLYANEALEVRQVSTYLSTKKFHLLFRLTCCQAVSTPSS